MILEYIFNISPVLRILLVFGLILVLSRFRLDLGIALIIGGLLIDIWAGNSLTQVLSDFNSALIQPELWLLLINITLILEFGYHMAHEKNSKVIVSASQKLGGRYGLPLSLMAMPAVIGLVPMPGGALFSAPLVGETVKDKDVPQPWKVVINYWFRHVLEYWWPLYPVVLVTLSIFTIPTWKFFALQIPFTLISLGVGWFFLLRPRLQPLSQNIVRIEETGGRLITVLFPIIIIVSCTLILPFFLKSFIPGWSETLNKLASMLVGLIISLLLIGWQNRNSPELRLFSNIISRKTLKVVMTLSGVMIFQSMLNSSDLLPEAGRQFLDMSIPVEIIIAFLPFLAGLVTGIAVGFAGPAFPLVVGLAEAAPGISESSALVLAFTMGYAGMMLSPVHLCYILTRRHFDVGLFPTYYYLVPCISVVALMGILFHVVLRYVGW